MDNLADELRMIRRKTGKSQKDFADILGIPQTTWSNYEVGKANPPLKILKKLSDLGYKIPSLTTGVVSDIKAQKIISENTLYKKQDNKKDSITAKIKETDFVIPIMQHKLSAGKGQITSDEETPAGYIAVPQSLKRYGKNLAALYVDGDSMEPTLRRGDLIVCDSCGWDGEGIYAIQMNGEGFVKRLSQQPGKIVVISDNPKYNSWEEPVESENLRIIGRVHYALKHVE